MAKDKRSVILPGSYDPVTLGHLDVIRRAAEEYSEVYAVVFINPEKTYTFSVEERVAMLMLATEDIENCIVSYSPGRVVDYMRDHDIDLIVKGYRSDADLEYERKQAEYNLRHGYETRLVLSDPALSHISSTLARERILRGESTEGILPDAVAEFIKESGRG
ncbi:MAG: pantetheine-phosphate adenylyltransferase [Clostridia bacterium]|nr:pantetheine-phosphate adenylyltransferase [Clostridia bacterium]